jgi:Restriction endonuclease XhoI
MSKETIFQSAVAAWWDSKDKNTSQITATQGRGRDANLRGDTMDGFRIVIEEFLVKLGVNKQDIFYGSSLSTTQSGVLPSYFRAGKNWDLVVVKRSHYKRLESPNDYPDLPELVAALEFKSQYGSIGNNQNNRIEESIGSAEDFWCAYEAKLFSRIQPRPWLGYLFVGKYTTETSATPVRVRQPHFPVDGMYGDAKNEYLQKISFNGPSYAQRYRIFLERLILKKKYDAACFVVTNEKLRSETPNYDILFDNFSGASFLQLLEKHIRGYYL